MKAAARKRRTVKRKAAVKPLGSEDHSGKAYPKIETPLIIPAQAGTSVLHVIATSSPRHVEILTHVCLFFERYPDRIVPRCMIAARDDVVEAAVLHPNGMVSGSPKVPITFGTIDAYRDSVVARYLDGEEKVTVEEGARRQATQPRRTARREPAEDLIG